MSLRPPSENDWSRIKMIADASVADVEGAGVQEEWLRNRRANSTIGYQKHFVYEDSGTIRGYGALERAPDAPDGHCRMFVVTAPNDLDTVGEILFEELQVVAINMAVCSSAGQLERTICFVVSRLPSQLPWRP